MERNLKAQISLLFSFSTWDFTLSCSILNENKLFTQCFDVGKYLRKQAKKTNRYLLDFHPESIVKNGQVLFLKNITTNLSYSHFLKKKIFKMTR